MNKKDHLKPAFILCGVVAIVIIILFLLSGNVNKNVVSNMTGKILYTEDGSGVRQYDFDDGTDILISGNIENACWGSFAGDKILFAGTDESGSWSIYFYDSDTKNTEALYRIPAGAELVGMTARSNYAAAAYFLNEEYFIDIYDIANSSGNSIVAADEEILAICIDDDCSKIYYTQMKNDNCVAKSVNLSGGNEQEILKAEKERISYIAFRGDSLYMCEDKNGNKTISQYSAKSQKATTLKFSSEDYNCTNICPVYDTEYIVSSDKGGVYELYVCNGSNMVKADGIGGVKDCFVTAYLKTED